ncbi:MAG: DUF6807 family protein [Planctomycetaceae bacterium]
MRTDTPVKTASGTFRPPIPFGSRRGSADSSRRHQPAVVAVFFSLLSAIAGATPADCNEAVEPRFSVTMDSDGILVQENDRPVLRYQTAVQSKDGRWPRNNYVHPVYDLDGNVITEDFPVDHGHHRGIFWAWHQVLVDGKPMGDSWVCEDFEWDLESRAAKLDHDKVTLSAAVLWKSPALVDDDGRQVPFVREATTITVHAQKDERRFVDFRITLQPLFDDVQIGGSPDEKGYGGFSPRIRLSDRTTFVGPAGEVEPQITSIEAGPWMDIASDQGGVTMVSHSGNPGFPEPWILRRESSMQNAAWPGREPVRLSKDHPPTLRYRLVIHRGPASYEQLRNGTKISKN